MWKASYERNERKPKMYMENVEAWRRLTAEDAAANHQTWVEASYERRGNNTKD